MVAVGLFAGAVAVPDLAAQGRQQIVNVGGGLSHYDIGGVRDNTWVLTVRFDGRFGPYVVFEPGIAVLRIEQQMGSRNYLLPELSLQFQGYLGPVRPYVGGGFGFANIATGVTENQWTLHAVTGLRVHLGGPWGMRVEGRARAIDPWYGHTLDYTISIARVIPSY